MKKKKKKPCEQVFANSCSQAGVGCHSPLVNLHTHRAAEE